MVRIPLHPLHCAILTIALPLAAQDAATSPPAEVQEKVREWVKTKKQVASEKADWEAEKQSLGELNAIRKTEIAQIDELLAAAGTRLSDAEKQRADLLAEEEVIRAWRKAAEARITKLESGLRAQLPKFPEPLRQKIGEAIERLENPLPDAPLQNRCRDVIAILSEVEIFESTITVHSELRKIGADTVEVDVLYLGLAQAWYVDRSGNRAGSGQPGDSGWQWTENPAMAGRVREAIDIQRKKSPPALIALPFAPAAK